jgi:hypothetical protein
MHAAPKSQRRQKSSERRSRFGSARFGIENDLGGVYPKIFHHVTSDV